MIQFLHSFSIFRFIWFSLSALFFSCLHSLSASIIALLSLTFYQRDGSNNNNERKNTFDPLSNSLVTHNNLNYWLSLFESHSYGYRFVASAAAGGGVVVATSSATMAALCLLILLLKTSKLLTTIHILL